MTATESVQKEIMELSELHEILHIYLSTKLAVDTVKTFSS